ncbi:MAG: DNA-3-methyladenine glycosylase 2 family protein, partial [Candidatus Pacebacteria bacterium]|nr:DNA-3-methyladenine glycosylase 2 family protein [Candidatus Paceibacterota bacterium]
MTLASPHDGFRALKDQVPAFAAAMEIYGQAPLRVWPAGFGTLVKIIAGQQLSTKAAAAIVARLEQSLGAVEPKKLLATSPESLREIGLSHAKIRAVHDLSQRLVDGRLDLEFLNRADDATVTEELTQVTGIGPWTSEIYLLFALNRPDIWPAADLALAVALQTLLGLDSRPDAAAMRHHAEGFKPWRSYAAHYLWHMYHCIKSPA